MRTAHSNPPRTGGNVVPFILPPTPFRFDRNPVADSFSYAMHFQWSLNVLMALCRELPAPDPRERVFVLPKLGFDDFNTRPSDHDGLLGLRDLLLAVSFLIGSEFAETGRCNVPAGYEDALFVMPWAFQRDAEAKDAAA